MVCSASRGSTGKGMGGEKVLGCVVMLFCVDDDDDGDDDGVRCCV